MTTGEHESKKGEKDRRRGKKIEGQQSLTHQARARVFIRLFSCLFPLTKIIKNKQEERKTNASNQCGKT